MVDYPDENPQSKDSRLDNQPPVVDYPDENPQSKDSRLEKRMSQVYVYSDEVLYLVTYVWRNVYPRSYVWSISSLALELE